jgi:hypothetical protein
VSLAEALAEPDPPPVRFVGLDVHKQYAVAAGVNDRQHVVPSPRRVELKDLGTWTAKSLRRTDIVVLEAMFNTWELRDQLTPARSRGRGGQPSSCRSHERSRGQDRRW